MIRRPPAAPHRPIVISGYYGFANAGDEAILQATVAGIRDRIPDAAITVLSADPAATSAVAGVPAAHRYRPAQFWPLMVRGGLFMSGGGGLFQDVTSRRSLVYYLAMLQLARVRGMKTMVYAQGLGPLRQRSSQIAVRLALRHVDQITFRDEASADLLARIGLPGRAEVTADPAFTLTSAAPERAREILRAEGCPLDTPLLAVAVRPWGAMGEEGRRVLAAALDRAGKAGAHPVFINMHAADDITAVRDLVGRMRSQHTILKGSYTPTELAAVIGQAQALAAMRLHALILGVLSGVPAVALTYDPKVDAAARQLGMQILDVRELKEEAVWPAIEGALAATPAEREGIIAAANVRKSRAARNFELAEGLVLA